MSLIAETKRIQFQVGVKADGVYGPVTARAILVTLNNAGKKPSEEKEHVTKRATEFVFDDRTERNLQTLDPKAQRIMRPFVARAQAMAAAARGCLYVAISGHRSYREQDKLYAKGRTAPGNRVTNAQGGYSNHNFAIALDFGVFRGGRYLDGSKLKSDRDLAAEVHRMVAAERAAKIEWGGDWRSFKDLPHFEVKTGRSMAEKRARVKAGRSVI